MILQDIEGGRWGVARGSKGSGTWVSERLMVFMNTKDTCTWRQQQQQQQQQQQPSCKQLQVNPTMCVCIHNLGQGKLKRGNIRPL